MKELPGSLSTGSRTSGKINGYDVTDKINVFIEDNEFVREAVKRHSAYIGSQTLATNVSLTSDFRNENIREVDIDEVKVKVQVVKNIL